MEGRKQKALDEKECIEKAKFDGRGWAWKAECDKAQWTWESGRQEKDEERTHHDQKHNCYFGGVLVPCLFWETSCLP